MKRNIIIALALFIVFPATALLANAKGSQAPKSPADAP